MTSHAASWYITAAISLVAVGAAVLMLACDHTAATGRLQNPSLQRTTCLIRVTCGEQYSCDSQQPCTHCMQPHQSGDAEVMFEHWPFLPSSVAKHDSRELAFCVESPHTTFWRDTQFTHGKDTSIVMCQHVDRVGHRMGKGLWSPRSYSK